MKNLKQEKLYKQAFYQVRDYILDNKLKLGDKLPTEAEMCEMLGISRNVLREAMKTLELIGIVVSKPGVGIVVHEYDMDFLYQNMFFGLIVDDRKLIDEILEIRQILEMAYSRDAFDAITDEDIQTLKEIIGQDKTVPFEDMDKQFHTTLYKNLNNKTLNSLSEAAWHVDRGINGVDVDSSSHGELIENHMMIIKALEKRDLNAFEDALDHHFSSGLYSTRGKYRRK